MRQGQQLYEAAIGAVNEQAGGGAQRQATREQRRALTVLNQWIAQYLKIAKIGLREKPELIEKIGCAVRSARTAAQRNAPKKAAETRAARLAA
jgi:hypothetical protein